MNDINKRVLEMAKIMVDGRLTVRQVAKIIGYSKSTVHHDLTTRLKDVDYSLYLQIKEILEYNKSSRHIRGGEATRLKYLLKSQQE